MKTEKKIFVEPHDSDELVLSRVRDAQCDHVVVNVARSSLFGASVEQFQTLLQEATSMNKEVTVESIDDHILELAALAGAKAVNPIFMTRARAVADIVPRRHAKRGASPARKEESQKRSVAHEEVDAPAARRSIVRVRGSIIPSRARVSRRTAIVLVSLAVLIVGFIYIGTSVLPKATITLTLAKTQVAIDEQITVTSNALVVDADGAGAIIVPGELLIATRNLEIPLETNGTETSGGKATGRLTVYNAYNTQPQILVATTRFESPDGKIFRLNDRVTVPGATNSGGTLIPGKIDVTVTADAPGEVFNIGPSKNWQIPGFKGTARYGKFYAESNVAMQGGFSGTRRVPTEADIQAGEAEIEKILREALEGELYVVVEDKFKILDGATKFSLTQKDVQARTDPSQGYGMFGEGELRRVVFDESMLQSAVVTKALRTLDPTLVVSTSSLAYGSVTANFIDGSLSFVVTGTITLQPPIAEGMIKERFAGADEALLRLQAIAIEGLDHVDVDLWPFWVSRVPKNLDKITIIVQ